MKGNRNTTKTNLNKSVRNSKERVDVSIGNTNIITINNIQLINKGNKIKEKKTRHLKRKYFSTCHHPLPLFRVSSYRKRNQLCDIMFAKDFAVNGKKEMKNMFLNHFGKKLFSQ